MTKRSLSTLAAFSCLCCLYCMFEIVSPVTLPRIRLDTAGKFRDGVGRQRVFHGFNRVLKEFPWYEPQLLNITRLAFYKKWGMNAARMGCMWTGTVPKPNMANKTYLAITMETVKRLADHGIYALLDMHQDVISSRYGSYDGVPLWLINSFPNDSLPYPFPLTSDIIKINWGLGYLTMAVGRAFEHLYKNTNAAWDHWGFFWSTVAETFKNQTSVIGYELINEPFAGDFFRNVKILMPGVAGRDNLMPVYDYLVSRIRAIDDNTMIFYEPVTWGVFSGSNASLGNGFDHVPGGASQKTKSVLSYHYYCWILTNESLPFSPLKKVLCDDILMSNVFTSVQSDLLRTGGGSFLTEFGECEPDGDPTSQNTEECELVMKKADDYMQSWTYWDFAFFDDDGNPRMDIVRAFVRPYPRAIAGDLTSFNFNSKTRVFTLSFLANIQIVEPTEIFIPVDVHYQGGFNVTIEPLLKNTFDRSNNLLHIFNRGLQEQLANGTPVRVLIVPRSSRRFKTY